MPQRAKKKAAKHSDRCNINIAMLAICISIRRARISKTGSPKQALCSEKTFGSVSCAKKI